LAIPAVVDRLPIGLLRRDLERKIRHLLGMTAPLMALAIPLLDTGLAIVRRFLRHQRFTADRNHIHHGCSIRGFSPRRVGVGGSTECAARAAFSLLQSMPANKFGGLDHRGLLRSTWIGVANWDTANSIPRGARAERTFRHILQTQLYMKTLEKDLSGAGTADDAGHHLQNRRVTSIHDVRMHLGSSDYEDPIVPRCRERLGPPFLTVCLARLLLKLRPSQQIVSPSIIAMTFTGRSSAIAQSDLAAMTSANAELTQRPARSRRLESSSQCRFPDD